MGQRRLPLSIPADLYRRLAAVAKREDRDPLQQARVLLRRALDDQDVRPNGAAPDKGGGK